MLTFKFALFLIQLTERGKEGGIERGEKEGARKEGREGGRREKENQKNEPLISVKHSEKNKI